MQARDTEIVKIDDEEWNAVEKEAENSRSHVEIKMSKPFEWEGETYDALNFDFSVLTGKDSLDIEREMRLKNMPLISPAFSGEYIIRVAVRACAEPIGLDALLALPLPVFNRIRTAVSAFLARSEI